MLKKISYLDDSKAPHRNRELKNLRYEKWKPINGHEGYFEVSNYGRIKSLARDVHYIDGKIIHKEERIIMAGVTPVPNYFANDYSYNLAINLQYEGNKFVYSVARLVYQHFVEELSGGKEKFVIVQKDGNGLNCHYKNLLAVTQVEFQKRIYRQKRKITCFSWIDMKATVQKGLHKRFRQVTQYNMKGKKIRTYKSIKEAGEATGVRKAAINSAVRGRHLSVGGYVWRYGAGEKQIDLSGYYEKGKMDYKEKRGKKIAQYTLEGKLVKKYPSVMDAAKETGISHSNISRTVNGYLKKTHGFLWKPSK